MRRFVVGLLVEVEEATSMNAAVQVVENASLQQVTYNNGGRIVGRRVYWAVERPAEEVIIPPTPDGYNA